MTSKAQPLRTKEKNCYFCNMSEHGRESYPNGYLIFDAGSTKTDICFVCPDDANEKTRRLECEGINPAIQGTDCLMDIFRNISGNFKEYDVTEVYYYGAGCTTPEIICKTKECLASVWTEADISVASDILGAARGLLGRSVGVACILGTGSNSALYNGEVIVENVPPLGFILGDEGSGNSLGRRLIGDIYKGIAPRYVKDDFERSFNLSLADVIKNVYRAEKPNAFLSSLTPFIAEHINEPYMRELVGDEFCRFLDRNVMQYKGVREIPVGFVGSVAYYFKDLLMDSLKTQGLIPGEIMRRPMDGLMEYHSAGAESNKKM